MFYNSFLCQVLLLLYERSRINIIWRLDLLNVQFGVLLVLNGWSCRDAHTSRHALYRWLYWILVYYVQHISLVAWLLSNHNLWLLCGLLKRLRLCTLLLKMAIFESIFVLEILWFSLRVIVSVILDIHVFVASQLLYSFGSFVFAILSLRRWIVQRLHFHSILWLHRWFRIHILLHLSKLLARYHLLNLNHILWIVIDLSLRNLISKVLSLVSLGTVFILVIWRI